MLKKTWPSPLTLCAPSGRHSMARWRKSGAAAPGVGKAHPTWCPLLRPRTRGVGVRANV